MSRSALASLRRSLLTMCLATVPTAAFAQSATLQSGVWWDPSESGWGLLLTDQGNILAPYWYTIDLDGEPTWFMAPAQRQADGSWRGDIYRVTGVPFAQIAGNAADPAQVIGQATLRFDNGRLAFNYTVGAHTGSKQLRRFDFAGKDVVCRASAAPSRATVSNYSDLWWNPQSSGWGLQITHVDNDLYVTWYTYDNDREPVYFNGSATRGADGRFSGRLFRTRNGTPYTQINGAAASSGADEIGSFTLAFDNGERGSFSYSVGNVTQTKAIERFQFGSTATVCTVEPYSNSNSNTGNGTGQGEECLPPYRLGDERRVRVTSTSNGATETLQRDERIVRSASFQGQSALVEEISGTTSAGTGVYARTYYAADGGNSIASFGSESLNPSSGQVLATSINDPIRIEQPRFFTAGQVWQRSWVIRSTAQGFTTNSDVSSRWRFVGRETVTTPAGSFNSCKFEIANEVSNGAVRVSDTGTAWTSPLWGIVKEQRSSSSQVSSPFGAATTQTMTTLELLSSRRNGQATP